MVISDKTKEKRNQDAFFMKLVQENKDLLLKKLGDPGGDKTNEAKMSKWAEIRDACIKNGCKKFEGKTTEYIRDQVFGVMKSRTSEARRFPKKRR